ncbi:major facilitator superfamily domain-containing protein [Chiua virens]|nr:major facilitator superfamily domain-containing protein [Chiua virens]
MLNLFQARSSSHAPPSPSIPSDTDEIPPSSARTKAENEFSEGGVAAWCTVISGFLVQFCGFGYLNSFGVYQAFYAQQYLENESSSAVSWIGSLGTLLITGMGPVCGLLFDKGYFYHVFIGGAVLQSLSLFMLSLVQPGQYYQVFLAQGLMSGIGQGLMYVPCLAILSHHFKRQSTAMMAIVASGASLGGIVHPIMLNNLLNGPLGFRTGVRISAALVTVLLSLACILARPRYSAMRHQTTEISFWKATKKCFTEVPSLLTILGFTLFQIPFFYPSFYFQVDSLQHGLSTTFSFYSLVIINAGSFVGRFLTGPMLRFIGIVELTILSTVVCAVLIIGMIWLKTVASVVVLGSLYGLFSGINIAVMAPMLGLTSDPAELGARMGVGFAITGIGSLVGSPICGALLTGRYIWWAPAVFCGAVALAASALFVGVRSSLVCFGSTRECRDDQHVKLVNGVGKEIGVYVVGSDREGNLVCQR